MTNLFWLALAFAATDTPAPQPLVDQASYMIVCKTVPSDACHTLALQHKEAVCQAGDGRACLVVGNVYRLGFNVPSDNTKQSAYYKRAATLLASACRADDAAACAALSEMYALGRGVSQDPSEADRLSKRAQKLRPPPTAVADDEAQ